MEIKLDNQQKDELTSTIVDLINDAITQVRDNDRPYVTRKEAANFFGVAPSTLTYWASLGMPVANIDGRKLYGKESITNWLKAQEQVVK